MLAQVLHQVYYGGGILAVIMHHTPGTGRKAMHGKLMKAGESELSHGHTKQTLAKGSCPFQCSMRVLYSISG